MVPPAADVSEDVAELQRLLTSASRPRVQELLRRSLAELEGRADVSGRASAEPVAMAVTSVRGTDPSGSGAPEVPARDEPKRVAGDPRSEVTVAAPQVAPSPAPVLLHAEKAPVQRRYISVPSFSWDQDSEKVKVYFFLDGVSKDKVALEVTPEAVDVRMDDVGVAGKNLRFSVPKLYASVDPENGKILVKPDRVIVVLRKAVCGHWPDLRMKEEKPKPQPKFDSSKDPMGGIMDLMKNMYDEGDEEMKRTIAKAWSNAQSGNAIDRNMPHFE